jgi:hypothetical protein
MGGVASIEDLRKTGEPLSLLMRRRSCGGRAALETLLVMRPQDREGDRAGRDRREDGVYAPAQRPIQIVMEAV